MFPSSNAKGGGFMISLKNTLLAIKGKLAEHEDSLRKGAWYSTKAQWTANSSGSQDTQYEMSLTFTGIPTNATNFIFVANEMRWCTICNIGYKQSGTSVTVSYSVNCTKGTSYMRSGGVLMYQLS